MYDLANGAGRPLKFLKLIFGSIFVCSIPYRQRKIVVLVVGVGRVICGRVNATDFGYSIGS